MVKVRSNGRTTFQASYYFLFSPFLSIYEDEHEQSARGNYMACASCNSFRLVCLYKYFIKKASQETEIIETLI